MRVQAMSNDGPSRRHQMRKNGQRDQECVIVDDNEFERVWVLDEGWARLDHRNEAT